MAKKFLVAAIIMALVVGLTGCGKTQDSKQAGGSEKLVIYTTITEEMINTLMPMFEKETGIKVELITAGAGELIKRATAEKENPYADILLGVLFGGNRSEHLGLFQEYISPNEKYMHEPHTNVTGVMTPFITNGSCILVNTDLIGDIKIEGYEDLLNPALKGKISSGDPTSSSSSFAQLTNMLLAMGGDYTSEKGWKYVEELLKNIDGKIASSSGAVHKSVADGEYVVALTYEHPSVTYVENGAHVKVVYPKEGTVFLDGTVGIVKDAKNLENAKKFVDFLITKPAQDALGAQLKSRPLREDADLGPHLKPFKDMNLIYEDEQYVDEHKAEIIERYLKILADVQQ